VKTLISNFLTKDFLKFLLTGGFAAGVNFCTRILLSKFLPFSVAVVLAYIVGMIIAFVLSKILVFEDAKNKKETPKQFFYFALVNVFAILQTLIVSLFLANYLFPKANITRYAEEIAHLVGISIPIFSSYLGHKYVTFKKSPVRNK
jgi:putative flippase GtrA